MGPVREATPPTVIVEAVTPCALPVCDTVGFAFPHAAATIVTNATTASEPRELRTCTYPLFQLSASIADAQARDATRAAQSLNGSTSASPILVDRPTSQADTDLGPREHRGRRWMTSR